MKPIPPISLGSRAVFPSPHVGGQRHGLRDADPVVHRAGWHDEELARRVLPGRQALDFELYCAFEHVGNFLAGMRVGPRRRARRRECRLRLHHLVAGGLEIRALQHLPFNRRRCRRADDAERQGQGHRKYRTDALLHHPVSLPLPCWRATLRSSAAQPRPSLYRPFSDATIPFGRKIPYAGSPTAPMRSRFRIVLELKTAVAHCARRPTVQPSATWPPTTVRCRADERAIVERHGGEIRVASEPGRTVFAIVLPLE